MKNFSFSIFNIISLITLVIIAICVFCPFELIDVKQAQRIAKWKSEFEQYNYCFSLVNTHEGVIIDNKDIENYDDELMISRIRPYFNFIEEDLHYIKKYKYKRKNGRTMSKNHQFYFDKFIKNKNGTLVSFKKNLYFSQNSQQPLYYMFIDINGEEKPNKIGHDIFFVNIFPHNIKATGYDKDFSKLKQNCSPIGSGIYCSEFYLLGGHF